MGATRPAQEKVPGHFTLASGAAVRSNTPAGCPKGQPGSRTPDGALDVPWQAALGTDLGRWRKGSWQLDSTPLKASLGKNVTTCTWYTVGAQ